MKIKKDKPAKEESAEVSTTPVAITMVPVDHIVNHPDIHYRKLDKEWAKELGEAIATSGLDQPLILWNGGDPDTQIKIAGKLLPATFLIAGQHRLAAIKGLRSKSRSEFKQFFPDGAVPCIVRGGSLEDALCTQLREGVLHKSPSNDEVFPVLQRLAGEFQMKQNEIADKIGKSTAWVSQILSVSDTLGKGAIDALSDGEMTVADATKAAKEVKQKRAKGEDVDPEEVVKKAKSKAADRKASGREREEKRVGTKKLIERYRSLPSMTLGKKLQVVEAMFAYIVGEVDELPDELTIEEEPAKE